MKRGFSLIELIFVMVIVGILSAVLIPRFNRPILTEAAHQLISHIRYTQHLAMINNTFTSSDSNWYKKRWQIQFGNTNGSDNQWAYTIFSDFQGGSTGVADKKEIAKNILNPQSKYMTGGYSAGVIPYIKSGKVNPSVTKEMNIGHHFGISSINFSGGCTNVSRRISFDNIGRPLFGAINSLDSQYVNTSNGKSYLLTSPCDINLSNNDEPIKSIIVRIEPETGYVHLL